MASLLEEGVSQVASQGVSLVDSQEASQEASQGVSQVDSPVVVLVES